MKTFGDVMTLEAPPADEVVRYGEEVLQFVELWRPAARPRAMVVLIHGGCWRNGYGVDHIRPLAAYLKSNGYLIWAPEYRRIGDVGGGWPGTFEDIAASVDAAGRWRAASDADQLPVVFAGHSAGGHLALWAGCRHTVTAGQPFSAADPLMPGAVMGLAAITDLVRYAAGQSSCERSTIELLGGTPDEVEGRYATTSPIALLPSGTRVSLIQGMNDDIVAADQAGRFVEAAIASGDSVRLRYVPGAGHFDLIHPGTLACDTALASLRELA
jgi:acetyl esterase/lipase